MNESNVNISKSIAPPLMQVLICTFGAEGIERIAKAQHPIVEGVEYLISWQLPDGDIEVPAALSRPDFVIIKNHTRGLSSNRNIALQAASAPICLISDDDVYYTEEGLKTVINGFSNNPQADIITFQFSCDKDIKFYPEKSFSLTRPPKGYYASSIEIAFRRRKVIDNGVCFNENFGIGGKFMAGEENIFLHDLLRAGLTGIFIPSVIAHHPSLSTSSRHDCNPEYIRTKGAVFTHIHPLTWPLRMLAHAVRHKPAESNGFTPVSRLRYMQLWLQGAKQAGKLNKKHYK